MRKISRCVFSRHTLGIRRELLRCVKTRRVWIDVYIFHVRLDLAWNHAVWFFTRSVISHPVWKGHNDSRRHRKVFETILINVECYLKEARLQWRLIFILCGNNNWYLSDYQLYCRILHQQFSNICFSISCSRNHIIS